MIKANIIVTLVYDSTFWFLKILRYKYTKKQLFNFFGHVFYGINN